MTKTKRTIKWIYEGDSGYWRSAEGRFTISPGGFRGGVTPDYYTVTDYMGDKVYLPRELKSKTGATLAYRPLEHKAYTVRDAKAWAAARVGA